MATDQAKPHTRRALLTAALGAGAATVVSSVIRPLPASAAGQGEAVMVGSENTATSVTLFDTSATAAIAVKGLSGSGAAVAGVSQSGIGVQGGGTSGDGVFGSSLTAYGVHGMSWGEAAVYGETPGSGKGVFGTSVAGHGVVGQSGPAYGVSGVSGSSFGVNGYSDTSIGVTGHSNGGLPGVRGGSTQGVLGSPPPDVLHGTGVHGYCDIDATSRGVHGQTTVGQGVVGQATVGQGVVGQATVGQGVVGQATVGQGVVGQATTGTGVLATAGAAGTALRVSGKASFSRSGRVLIGAGKSYVDVTVPGGVASNALCFANLAVYRAGVFVAAVRPAYPAAGKMRIYLNKALGAATSVSWIVMG